MLVPGKAGNMSSDCDEQILQHGRTGLLSAKLHLEQSQREDRHTVGLGYVRRMCSQRLHHRLERHRRPTLSEACQ